MVGMLVVAAMAVLVVAVVVVARGIYTYNINLY